MNRESKQKGFVNAVADCLITWVNILEIKENEHGKGKENPKNPRQ